MVDLTGAKDVTNEYRGIDLTGAKDVTNEYIKKTTPWYSPAVEFLKGVADAPFGLADIASSALGRYGSVVEGLGKTIGWKAMESGGKNIKEYYTTGLQETDKIRKDLGITPANPDITKVEGIKDALDFAAYNIGNMALPVGTAATSVKAVTKLLPKIQTLYPSLTEPMAEKLATFLSSFLTEHSEVTKKQAEKGDIDDSLRAIAGAGGAAALETHAMNKLLGRFGKEVAGSLPARVLKSGAQQAITEGVMTEPVQSVLERYGAGQELTSSEAFNEYLNALAGGLAGGAFFGGLGGASQVKPVKKQSVLESLIAEADQPKPIAQIVEPKNTAIVGTKFYDVLNKIAEGLRTGQDLLSQEEKVFLNNIMAQDSPFADLLNLQKQQSVTETPSVYSRRKPPIVEAVEANTTLEAPTPPELPKLPEGGVINSITTKEAADLAINGKGKELAKHIQEGIESGIDPNAIADGVRNATLSRVIEVAENKEQRKAMLKKIAEKVEPEINKALKGEFAEPTAVNPPTKKPALSPDIVTFLIERGGINYNKEKGGGYTGELDSLKEALPKPVFSKLVRKQKTENAKSLDNALTMAIEEGYLPESATLDDLIDAIKKRSKHPEVLEYEAEKMMEAEAQKDIFPDAFPKGTVFDIDGEKFKITGHTKEGGAILKDGEIISLDPFDTIKPDKIILPNGKVLTKNFKDYIFKKSHQEFSLKSKAPEIKRKASQPDMIGVKQGLEGKLPSEEFKEDMPLEKAIQEEIARQESEKQMPLEKTSTTEKTKGAEEQKLYSGIPIDEAKQSIVAVRDAVVKKFPKLESLLGLPSEFQGLQRKGMGSIKGLLTLPETLARVWGKRYPEIANIYQHMRIRYLQADSWVNNVNKFWGKLNKLGKEDVMAALDVYKHSSNLNDLSPYFKSLTPKQQIIFKRIHSKMKEIHDDYINTAKNAIIDYIKITPTIKDERTRNACIKAVEKMSSDNVDHKTIKGMIDTLREFSGRFKYYSPQVRDGKFMVRLTDKEGKTLFAKAFDTETEALQYKNNLNESPIKTLSEWFNQAKIEPSANLVNAIKSGEYNITHDTLENLPYEAIDGLDLKKAVELINDMVADKNVDTTAEIYKEVAEQLLEMNMAKGWSRYRIHRENIPGYELDSEKVLRQIQSYMKGYGYAKAKGEAIKNVSKQWNRIIGREHDKLPQNLIIHVKDYIDYSFGTPESQAATKIAHGISAYYLLGNIVSSITNSTQNFTLGNAVLLKNGLPILNPKAIIDIHTKNLTFKEKKAIAYLLKSGYGEAMIWEEMLGKGGEYADIIRNILSDMKELKHLNLKNTAKIFGDAIDLGMLPFKHVETFVNRLPMFLHTYRTLTQRGIGHQDAITKAIELMNEAHFEAMRYNRAKFQRGNIGRPITALMTFNIHAFKEMNRLFHEAGFSTKEQKQASAALLYLIASTAVIGGAQALPIIAMGTEGWDLLRWLWRQQTGRDLDADIKSLPPALADFVQGGILRLIGLGGLSSRLSFGFNITDPTRNVVGVNLARRAMEAKELLEEGQTDRAVVRLLPGGAKYAGEAYLASKYGLSSKTGTPILDEEGEKIMPSKIETLLKGMGVESNRIINMRESIEIIKRAEKQRKKELTKFRNRLMRADTDEKEDAVWDDLDAYNEKIDALYDKAEAEGREDEMERLMMLYISAEDLIRSLKSKERGVISNKKGQVYFEQLSNGG